MSEGSRVFSAFVIPGNLLINKLKIYEFHSTKLCNPLGAASGVRLAPYSIADTESLPVCHALALFINLPIIDLSHLDHQTGYSATCIGRSHIHYSMYNLRRMILSSDQVTPYHPKSAPILSPLQIKNIQVNIDIQNLKWVS
jgi:hypothetical protein